MNKVTVPKVKAEVPLVVAVPVFAELWSTVNGRHRRRNSYFGRNVFVHCWQMSGARDDSETG